MIFREQPSLEWEPFDFALTEALEILESETCGMCGHPVWLCDSKSRYLEFKTRTRICRATVVIENKRNPKAEREDKANFGKTYYAVPEMRFDKPLPTRNEYYTEKLNVGK